LTLIARHSCVGLGLCVALALPVHIGYGAAPDALAACRSASTDNFSFSECVGLRHQASEAALSGVEALWRDYLAAEQDNTAESSVSDEAGLTATPGPGDTSDDQVIAIVGGDSDVVEISNETLLESQYPALNNDIELTPQAQIDRFERLSASYRQLRDQQCVWEAGLYGAGQTAVYNAACQAVFNEQQAGALRSQLAETRARVANGVFFRGFYIEDSDGGIFQSCDRRREWRLTGDDEALSAIALRYGEIAQDSLEMAYLEIRGNLDNSDAVAADGFSGLLQVRSVNLIRAIGDSDCSTAQPVLLARSSSDSAPETDSPDTAPEPADTDVTVDALGAAGFLYGYFANWVSACAIDENTVCMTQAESGVSGSGEWRLVIDRSLEGQWRVQLISVISAATIDRSIEIDIDGNPATVRNVAGAGVALETGAGMTLVQGEAARRLVSQMRRGQILTLDWTPPSEIGNQVSFSLIGISRALAFFDQAG
jgi:hypothetical protein